MVIFATMRSLSVVLFGLIAVALVSGQELGIPLNDVDTDLDKFLDERDNDYIQEQYFDVAVNTLLPAGAAAVRTESDGGNQVTFLRLVRFRTFESLSSGEGGPGFDGEAGSAFYTSSVPLQEMAGFKSISTMKIQDFQGCADGSDGFAFVIHPYTGIFLGNKKDSLGHIGNSLGDNYFALRYDTYFLDGAVPCQNSRIDRPPCGIHFAVWVGGNYVGYSGHVRDMRSGLDHSLAIRYLADTDEISVWIDRTPEFTYANCGLGSILRAAGPNGLSIGWTGSTGSSPGNDPTGCAWGMGTSQDVDIYDWRFLEMTKRLGPAVVDIWVNQDGSPTLLTYVAAGASFGLCCFVLYTRQYLIDYNEERKRKREAKKAAKIAELTDMDHNGESYDPIGATLKATAAIVGKQSTVGSSAGGRSRAGSKGSRGSRGSRGTNRSRGTSTSAATSGGSLVVTIHSSGSKGSRGSRSRSGSKKHH